MNEAAITNHVDRFIDSPAAGRIALSAPWEHFSGLASGKVRSDPGRVNQVFCRLR